MKYNKIVVMGVLAGLLLTGCGASQGTSENTVAAASDETGAAAAESTAAEETTADTSAETATETAAEVETASESQTEQAAEADTQAETAGAESEDTAVELPAADAALEGVRLKDTPAESEIYYDDADNCIIGIGEFSSATYTVPESASAAAYDIYLNVSRASNAFVAGSTPVTYTINDGKTMVPSIPETPCTMEQMGMNGDPTYQQDMGLFRIARNEELAPGDTIRIGGVAGSEFYYDGNYECSLPALGDIVLYPAGTEVTEGYSDNPFVEKDETPDSTDPLSGLNIAWLGSSVTYGQGANGYSMADEIANIHSATTSYKYAISGTTLADYGGGLPTDEGGSHGSYVERLKMLDPDTDYDLFIVQLSTNDATGGIPMGEISDGKDIDSFDTATVIGSMEYIIAYIRQNWDCPVMFYTGTKYDSEQYGEMVKDLLRLQDKWDIGVIDLWDDADMNAVSEEDYARYMKEDGIHPLREGYVEWWTPKFEEYITEYLASLK